MIHSNMNSNHVNLKEKEQKITCTVRGALRWSVIYVAKKNVVA